MSRPIVSRRWISLGVLFTALALGAAGCGGGTAKVSGTVKYKGKPLTSGNVVFIDKDGKASPPAYIQPDGTYAAINVPTGSVKVIVDAPPPSPPESTSDKASPEYKEYESKLASYVQIPAHYKDPQRSGLTFDVKSGSNPYNIELEGEIEKTPVNDPNYQP